MGFNCGDPKLSYKFHGDTVSANTLLVVTFCAPLIVLMSTEWKYGKRNGIRWAWLKQAFVHYRYFLSGFLIVFTVVTVCKVIVGEPRPHFFDTCHPKEAVNCTSGYFTTYKCLNRNVSSYMMRDARKSFPSGHAGFSFYLLTYLTLFLYNKLRRVNPFDLVWCCIIFAWAMFCALSRVTDRRHHWWDVLAGGIIGVVIAIFSKRTFIEDGSTADDNKKHNVQDISSNLSQILKSTHSYNNMYHSQLPKSIECTVEGNQNRSIET